MSWVVWHRRERRDDDIDDRHDDINDRHDDINDRHDDINDRNDDINDRHDDIDDRHDDIISRCDDSWLWRPNRELSWAVVRHQTTSTKQKPLHSRRGDVYPAGTLLPV